LIQRALDLYVHLSLWCTDFGPWLRRFPKGLLSKVHRSFKSVSCEVHVFFSTFLYYLRDFENDLVNSFELCRAYMSYKLKGGLYDFKKMKPLHVRTKYPVILNKHSYLSCVYMYEYEFSMTLKHLQQSTQTLFHRWHAWPIFLERNSLVEEKIIPLLVDHIVCLKMIPFPKIWTWYKKQCFKKYTPAVA
jgi:hypothetical protein